MSGTYIKAARADEVPPGERLLVEVDEQIVVLFNVGGEFFALDDVCTHDDGPLSEGKLEDHTIACPRHGAKFDVRNGKALTMTATKPARAYECKVENGDVLILVAAASSAAETSTAAPAGAVLDRPAPTSAPTTLQSAGSLAVKSDETCVAPPIQENPALAGEGAPTELNEDSIREALKQVIDPELFVNIVDLGLIYGVTLGELPEGKSHIAIDMTMTSPACPAGPQLIQNSKDVLGRLPNVGGVDVKLVMVPPWTPDRMTEAARDQLGIF